MPRELKNPARLCTMPGWSRQTTSTEYVTTSLRAARCSVRRRLTVMPARIAQLLQLGLELGERVPVARDQQQHRELAAERAHPAVDDVAGAVEHDAGEVVDEAGAVAAECADDDELHRMGERKRWAGRKFTGSARGENAAAAENDESGRNRRSQGFRGHFADFCPPRLARAARPVRSAPRFPPAKDFRTPCSAAVSWRSSRPCRRTAQWITRRSIAWSNSMLPTAPTASSRSARPANRRR